VDLSGQLSNPQPALEALADKVILPSGDGPKAEQRPPEPTRRPRFQTQRRLSADQIAVLVEAYRSRRTGTPCSLRWELTVVRWMPNSDASSFMVLPGQVRIVSATPGDLRWPTEVHSVLEQAEASPIVLAEGDGLAVEDQPMRRQAGHACEFAARVTSSMAESLAAEYSVCVELKVQRVLLIADGELALVSARSC